MILEKQANGRYSVRINGVWHQTDATTAVEALRLATVHNQAFNR